jgi:hypothetical protein
MIKRMQPVTSFAAVAAVAAADLTAVAGGVPLFGGGHSGRPSTFKNNNQQALPERPGGQPWTDGQYTRKSGAEGQSSYPGLAPTQPGVFEMPGSIAHPKPQGRHEIDGREKMVID